ncbi:MAG: tetratricopeptide repeat protein [Ekhidna sp.]
MRITFSLLCLITTLFSTAQQQTIDSLVSQIEANKSLDSIRVRLMNELAYTYRSTNPDSSIAIANRALDLANTLKIAYEKAWALNGLSSAYWMKANYPQVLKYAKESLTIFQDIENDQGIAQAYNTLANTFNMQGQHENSLAYYQKTIEMYERLGDSFNIARANANIGRTYFMIQKYDQALLSLQKVIDNYIDEPDNLLYPIALNTQGDVYQAKEQLDKALSNYLVALKITERLNIPRIVTYSTRGISEVYQKKGLLKMSNEYALKTLSISRQISYLENQKNAALIISNNYKKLGVFDQAYNFYTQYSAVKDSMFNQAKIQEITKLEESFKIAQNEKEIQLLRVQSDLQKETNHNQELWLYGVGVITLLSIVIGTIQFRKKQLKQEANKRLKKLNKDVRNQKDQLEIAVESLNKTKVELEEAVETKDKFFAIVSHDLKSLAGQYSSTTYLLDMHLKQKNHDKMAMLIEMAKDSSQNMTRLLDNLLNWALQTKNNIPYSPKMVNISGLVNETIDLFATQLGGKEIKAINNTAKDHIMYADENCMKTVFRNLMSNAIKFTESGKSIRIDSFMSGEKICIKFIDEGVGIECEKINNLFEMFQGKSTEGTSGEKGVGLGLKLVYDFISLNKGSIEVESELDKGTTFILELPIKS